MSDFTFWKKSMSQFNNILKQTQRTAPTDYRYFNALVTDCIKLLRRKQPAYVYKLEHIDAIRQVYPHIFVEEIYTEIYKITVRKEASYVQIKKKTKE